MSHNITYNSITGTWEVMTRGAAWHQLGQVVQDVQTWEDTRALAGLDWTVSKQQLELMAMPVSAYGIFRDDYLHAGDVSRAFIAPTTETYELMQNDYLFAFLDTVLESEGAHYESAGSLNNGAQVWVLVNTHKAFEIGHSGDRYETYLCFTEDRTGKRAARAFLTTVRVVCANTLEAALRASDRAGQDAVLTFRHTKNLTEKLEQAAAAFTGVPMSVEALSGKLNRLAERVVTRDTLESILNRLFPAENQKAAESPARVQKMLDVVKLFESNDYNQFPEIRGTPYNLLNAFTEWTDHYSGVRRTAGRVGQTDDQIRAERAMFGDGSAAKQTALDIILEETAYAPLKTTRRVVSGGVAVLEQERVATRAMSDDTDNSGLLDSILDAAVIGEE